MSLREDEWEERKDCILQAWIVPSRVDGIGVHCREMNGTEPFRKLCLARNEKMTTTYEHVYESRNCLMGRSLKGKHFPYIYSAMH